VETSKEKSTWLAYHRPNPQARLRLFCFPYAGGSASAFGAWPNHISTDVDVCPVQLPGRESRLKESPYRRLTPLVEALADALLPLFDKPFAFFGHSMGALIGFELARHLRKRALPQPIHLFVAGARAPQLPEIEPPVHHLPEKEFVDALRSFNGTPEEVLQHKELMEILLPCMRADFEICETHIYQPDAPLSVPVTVFGGWQDKKIPAQDLGVWRDQTSAACAVHMLPGDHFFLHTSREQLLQIMSNVLKQH
jgi:medium-chain acyl-[acyl-carrier-protein] hydrolase